MAEDAVVTIAPSPSTSVLSKEEVPIALKLAAAGDTSKFAYALVRTFMSEEKWRDYAASVRHRFDEWAREHDGDIGLYLNDRLSAVALSVSSCKVERLKDGALFVALYQEFGQPVPKALADFTAENLPSLNVLFAAFTWEKCGAYIRNRQWKKDKETERKKAAVGTP